MKLSSCALEVGRSEKIAIVEQHCFRKLRNCDCGSAFFKLQNCNSRLLKKLRVPIFDENTIQTYFSSVDV